MGETTAISWTDATFNPWVGCQRVSPGCEHCYAEALDKRVGGALVDGVKKLRWGPTAPRVRTSPANWKQPLKWNRKAAAEGVRKRVFCASMADVFEDRPELVPWRLDLFKLIDSTPNLDWLLLTKRPENIRSMLPNWSESVHMWPRANVWLGTTAEDQQRFNERVPHLLLAPAAVRFLSCEPLLERLNIWPLMSEFNPPHSRIDWVIIGGESGGKARPFDVAWVRDLIPKVRRADAAVFVKQLGSNIVDRNDAGFDAQWPEAWPASEEYGGHTRVEHLDHGYQGAPVRVHLRDRAGGDPAEWPLDLRVREFPEVRR